MAGEDVYVVGGANSAGQAALHLARYAARVTLLVRGESLAAGMSDYLIRQIEATPNVVVRLRTQVVGGRGAARLEALTLEDLRSDQQEQVPAAAVFIMIGAEPRTEWLAPALQPRRARVRPDRPRRPCERLAAAAGAATRSRPACPASSRPVTCGTARSSGSPARSARARWPSVRSTGTWPSWPPRLNRRGGRPWRTQRLCDPRPPRPAAGAARPSSPS